MGGGRREIGVVGIGASAGGLGVLRTFFEAMPADSGFAFVIVLHLAPDRESSVPAILARHTAMPVREATDGIPVEPGRVYVIPPDKTMEIEGGRLRLSAPIQLRGMRRPIDAFFHSLARDVGPRAVAIVLTGGGNDGAAGAFEVRRRGGLVLVQNPGDAEHTAMPEHAISNGAADFVLSVEEMPGFLLGGTHENAFDDRDLDHALTTAGVAVLFLDGALRVRGFTPEAIRLFGFVHADAGRPLSDRLAGAAAARAVLESREPAEIELVGEDGGPRLCRVLPARAGGVVLVLVADACRAAGAESRVVTPDGDRHQTMLVRELMHRVKNTLAVVKSIASQTVASSDSLPAFAEAFEGRLVALGRVHGLLTRGGGGGTDLERLLRGVLEPYPRAAECVGCEGPAVALAPAAAVALGMVLHEIATNAAKYGALSVPTGRVSAVWRVSEGVVDLRWEEEGGPEVRPGPAGFGTRMIEETLRYELSGAAEIDRRPTGIVYRLTFRP